jgi:hypothetical protein
MLTGDTAPMADSRVVPEAIVAKARLYRFHQRFWLYLHYFAGIVGVFAGAAATLDEAGKFAGVLAATAASVVTDLGPQQRGDRYKQAQLRLEGAILRFQTIHSTTIEWLLNEFDRTQNQVLGINGGPTPVQETPHDPSHRGPV